MNQSTTSYNRSVIVGIFLVGAFVAILNQTLLIPAIPHIMEDFNIADKRDSHPDYGFLN